MADRARGMGRGLAAILSVPTAGADGGDLRTVPIDAIAPNPDQPRRRFDEDGLTALAASLEERGVLQPVLVRPAEPGRYELIAGERRWRAAKLAGLAAIPALVRESDDAASLELALVENMAREDLNPVEEARACAALVEELGITREAVARRVGRNRVTISNLIRLLDLPDEALELLESGVLSEGHGRALLMAPDHGERRRLARAAAEHGWTVRELEARARGAAGRERPRRTTRRSIPPDEQEAMTRVAEGLGARLGCDVTVRPHAGGYRATVDFASLEEALETAGGRGAQDANGGAAGPSGGPPGPR